MSADFQPVTSRKGLAIASLVLGIISIPTLGLLVVGGITGIILGGVALSKIKNNPQVYSGRGLAIAGIVTSAVSLALIFVFGILGAIVIPKLQQNLKRGREIAAIQSLKTIYGNELQYKEMNSRFATLEELAKAGLIDGNYVNKTVSGYIYISGGVSDKTFCVHATRTSDTVAFRDFVVCQNGIIRYNESKIPQSASPIDGTPLND